MRRLCFAFSLVTVLLLATGARSGPALAAAEPPAVPTPLGVTLSGTQWGRPLATIDAQIAAIRDYWHANVVRLQVQQDRFDIDPAYRSYIRAAAGAGLSAGLSVVINPQTEPVRGWTADEPLPTQQTIDFWRLMIASYKNNPAVVFDLFNEPRVPDTAADWALWRDGGSYRGVTYLGMQTVLDFIRSQGAENVVWADGLAAASTLDSVPSYPLTGGRVIYSFHHPAGPHDPSAWYRDFGYLSALHIPVVNGEFTNYEQGYCWRDAPTALPVYLDYLQAHGIGMTAWTFGGALNGAGGLADVSVIDSAWSCPGSGLEGPGQLLMDWFAAH
jgi:hypothetical protein